MNQNSKKGSCGILKVDKEKMLSAKITGKLNTKKTALSSNEWASEDVLLTVTTNPKKIPSGALYQWYKDGEKIGEETPSSTYIAIEDGTYYAEVTNTLHNQKIKTNEFKVRIDRVAPTITVKQSPISLGTQDYNFIDNVTYTFSISEGSVKCSPASTRKTGSYTVTCVATGGNKLTASISFTARHSYAASARSISHSYECGDRKCWDEYSGCNSCDGSCCSPGGGCTSSCCACHPGYTRVCSGSNKTCYWYSTEYYCPISGTTLCGDGKTCCY